MNVYVSRKANSQVQGWPSVTCRPELWLRCKEGTTEMLVITGMEPQVESHRSSFDWASVTVRLDKDPAREGVVRKSSDGKGLFFPEAQEGIVGLLGHDSMLFRFTPFKSPPAMTTFDLDGLDEAVAPLRLSCGW